MSRKSRMGSGKETFPLNLSETLLRENFKKTIIA